MTSRTSDLQINLNGFFSPSPPSARRALPGAPVARNSLMPYVAAITKLYLRAVTRQVLQNRCPHGVESTSFQEGKPLRGSRQIGHWRGSSDILKVSSFYVFKKSCWRNSLTVKYPGILRLPSEDSKIIANCITNLWRALAFWEYLQAKSRWGLN